MKVLYAFAIGIFAWSSVSAATKTFNIGEWSTEAFDNSLVYPISEDVCAPVNFSKVNSGSQTIFTPDELKTLLTESGTISKLTMVYYDDGVYD